MRPASHSRPETAGHAAAPVRPVSCATVQPHAPEPSEDGPTPTPVVRDPSGSGWDPSGPMPSVPLTGYSVPYFPQPGFDPLISPDVTGWWRRSTAIIKAGWMQLAAIQAIGAAVQVVVQVP